MKNECKIPRCMSTQHPDNVKMPFFVEGSIFSGEDEIKEAYYVFSRLGCNEQMWDSEGKEADEYVVKKLLSRDDSFFKDKRMGRDLFITLRVPNPAVEKDEAKILLETLESIPRSFDAAKIFYGNDIPPVFEVILPMTTNSSCIKRIYCYYKDFVAGKKDKYLFKDDIPIKEWIGDFKPDKINVIPLFEDMPSILEAANIVAEILEYMKDEDINYQRVFIARSDPAMNYGMLSAILLIKIALKKLYELEKKLSIPIYPIIGVGSCPFRGNFKPINVDNCLRGYPSVQTFTIQSAFKYDYDEKTVASAIEKVQNIKREAPLPVDEKRALEIINKVSQEYTKQIRLLAPLINEFAKFIPSRRLRKLHIGLFGYAREVGGIKLPRVITFCASLYSIGLPPEILGLGILTKKDITDIKEVYPDFEEDLKDALVYLNKDVFPLIPKKIVKTIEKVKSYVSYKEDEEHNFTTSQIIKSYNNGLHSNIPELVVYAGRIRRFLG